MLGTERSQALDRWEGIQMYYLEILSNINEAIEE
jgi:hypothetical protein